MATATARLEDLQLELLEKETCLRNTESDLRGDLKSKNSRHVSELKELHALLRTTTTAVIQLLPQHTMSTCGGHRHSMSQHVPLMQKPPTPIRVIVAVSTGSTESVPTWTWIVD